MLCDRSIYEDKSAVHSIYRFRTTLIPDGMGYVDHGADVFDDDEEDPGERRRKQKKDKGNCLEYCKIVVSKQKLHIFLLFQVGHSGSRKLCVGGRFLS